MSKTSFHTKAIRLVV